MYFISLRPLRSQMQVLKVDYLPGNSVALSLYKLPTVKPLETKHFVKPSDSLTGPDLEGFHCKELYLIIWLCQIVQLHCFPIVTKGW